MMPIMEDLTQLQKDIFAKISNNEVCELKTLLATNKININFVDENGMSPLQHACYKGNKEIVQMLLDQVGYVFYKECFVFHYKVLLGIQNIVFNSCSFSSVDLYAICSIA